MSDLSVEVAGVKFKNPILPGSGELAEDVRGVKRMIDAGVGGVVTKSYTSMKQVVRRPKPNNFPLPGRGYTQNGAFITYSTSHPVTVDEMCETEWPKMADLCKKAGVPFILSYWGWIEADERGVLKPGGADDWAKVAQMCEKAGADIIEANLSCPVVRAPFEANSLIAGDICKAVVEAVKVPVTFKISPTMGPLVQLTKMIADSGAMGISAHNAPDGVLIDVEHETPYGAPGIGGYILGRNFIPWSLSRVVQMKKTSDIEVMGIGGVYNYQDAISYMLCGCPLVQVCTAIYLKGPKVFGEILEGMEAWMERKGYGNVREFIGKCVPMILPGSVLKENEPNPWAMPPNTPFVPVVDEDKCTLCGSCEACFSQVYKVDKENGKVNVEDRYCVSCGMCVGVCPAKAITLVDRKTKKEVIWAGEGLAKPYVDLLKAKNIL